MIKYLTTVIYMKQNKKQTQSFLFRNENFNNNFPYIINSEKKGKIHLKTKTSEKKLSSTKDMVRKKRKNYNKH